MSSAKTSIRFTLRGRVIGWLAVLATGAAWVGGDANARLAASLLAAPLLVDFLLKPRRLHAATLKVAPRRTIASALFVEHVSIEHGGRWPLRECLLLEPLTMRAEARSLLPPLPAGQPARIEIHARSKQRGRRLERTFVLATAWPLGLFRASAVVTGAAELLTEPARITIGADVTRRIVDRHSIHDVARGPHGSEFHSLREQIVGEDARGVHARRSAAAGVLVRRVDHGSAPERVGIVLDLRRPPGSSRDRRSPRFEWGMSACATLVVELRRKGCSVRIFVVGDDIVERAVETFAAEREAMAMLAEATSVGHRTLPAEQLDALRRLEHCFWIPAGTRAAPTEIESLKTAITVVKDPRE